MSYTADPTLSAAINPTATSTSSSTGAAMTTSKAAANGLVPPMSYGALGTVTWIVLVTVITGAIRLL